MRGEGGREKEKLRGTGGEMRERHGERVKEGETERERKGDH